MGRSRLGALLVVAALAGCGAEEDRAQAPTRDAMTRPPAAQPAEHCVASRAPGFRLCERERPNHDSYATIQRREGTAWTVVAGDPPRLHKRQVGPLGFWREAWLSPDGGQLLAQWSGECEIPIAFFVDVTTGEMRPVTGEKDWTTAPESIALGWSADGRARVQFTEGLCGGAKYPPGIYLVDPGTGKPSLVKRLAARG